MAEKPKISYDKQYDLLYIHSGEQAADTVQRGNFVVELSNDNRVVGIQIENASDTFSTLLGEDFSKDDFATISGAELAVTHQGNVAFVTLFLTLHRDGKEVREALPINLPSGTMATA